MSDRVGREQAVYDSVSVLHSSGEIDVWDDIIFPRVIRHRELRFLDPAISRVSPGLVLDVGCGGGWSTRHVNQLGYRAVGVDVSRPLLLEARSVAPAAIGFILADASNLPVKAGTVGLLLSVAALHHLAVKEALDDWRRVLKPGGHAVLLEPNSRNPLAEIGRRIFRLETHTPEERPFTPKELQEILTEHGWDIVGLKVEVIVSFAASRICRLVRPPAKWAILLANLLEIVERAAEKSGIARRFGWVIQCSARRGD